MKKNRFKNKEKVLEQPINESVSSIEEKNQSSAVENTPDLETDNANIPENNISESSSENSSAIKESAEEGVSEEAQSQEDGVEDTEKTESSNEVDNEEDSEDVDQKKKLSAKERRKLEKKKKKDKAPSEEPIVDASNNTAEGEDVENNQPSDKEENEKEDTEEPQAQESTDEEKTASEEEEAEKKLAEEKAKRKAEKKAKRKAWRKAHRKLIAILSIILIIVAGVTVSHFVVTRNVAFIHNENDLVKLAAKEKNTRTNLIFKDNVTVNGDLSINNCNFDLNEYTLTVKGDLNLSNKEKGSIGKQQSIWSDYRLGGNIVVEGDLTLNGLSYVLLSNIQADSVIIIADEATVSGEVRSFSEEKSNIYFKLNKAGEAVASDYSKNSGILTIDSKVDGNVCLSKESELSLVGEVGIISGGAKVTLCDYSTCSSVEKCKKLFIQPNANWSSFDKITVEEYFFVEKLASPTILFVNNSEEQYIRISNVENADAYILVYDGSEEIRIEKAVGSKYTEYKLPYKDPGNYQITIYAISDNSEKYLNGNAVASNISIYAKLANPVILGCEEVLDENGDVKTLLKIEKVPHALQYEININGKSFEVSISEGDVLSVDISEYISTPGISDIFVTAKANGTNYTDSDKELYSYVKTQKLVLEGLNATLTEDSYVVTWLNLKGAKAYEVSIYDQEGKLVQHYITTSTAIILEKKMDVRVRPLGYEFYKDGDEVTVIDTPTLPDDQDTPSNEGQGETPSGEGQESTIDE